MTESYRHCAVLEHSYVSEDYVDRVGSGLKPRQLSGWPGQMGWDTVSLEVQACCCSEPPLCFLPKMIETHQDPTHQELRASQTPSLPDRQLGFRYWLGQAAPFPGSSSLSVPVLKQLTLTEG